MKKPKNQISATEFKKHFLSLVDEVKNKHSSFIITKRKIPIAQVVPLENINQSKKSYFGCTKGIITINSNIIDESFESDWEVNE